jgi:hypothetical protein
MHGSMHVSGSYRWVKKGGSLGVSIFDGGRLPVPGGRIHPSTPCELAGNRPVERPSYRPTPASTKCNFVVLFPRNAEPHRVGQAS